MFCQTTKASTVSTEAHFLRLYREVCYGTLVLYVGGLKQASGGFHRTDVNLHANLGEKGRVFVVEELRGPLGLNCTKKTKTGEAHIALDASLDRLDPLTRTFRNMLQELRHLIRKERFLVHLPANNRAYLHGNNRFPLHVDNDAKQSREAKSEAVFVVVIVLEACRQSFLQPDKRNKP